MTWWPSVHRGDAPARTLRRRPVVLAAAALGLLVAPAAVAQADDLSVTIAPDNPVSFDGQDLGWFQELGWTVTVTNSGPDAAPPTAVTVDPPGLSSDDECNQPTLARSNVVCQVPALAAGESFNTLVVSEVHHADMSLSSPPRAMASVPCGQPQESDCTNNTAAGAAVVAYAPQVRISTRSGPIRARARLRLSGTAAPAEPSSPSAVAGVQVAVRRRRGGVCRWLDRRGDFARTAVTGGGCDHALWLPADGTTAWRLALARGLPRGSYSVYARATSVSGATDSSFTRRRGNAITIQAR